jgi:addiction module RelE/StbE family toxin
MALADRDTLMDYIAQDNPTAAIELDDEFEAKAEQARQRPTLYRTGRVKGAREVAVRPHYVMVYRIEDEGDTLAVLRILHAAQQWPPAKP